MSAQFLEHYRAKYEQILKPTAAALEQYLADIMGAAPRVTRIDRVVVRAKTPDSFHTKATKKTRSGDSYYSDPMTQIQDQVGARIIVFFLDDVDSACARVMRYMTVAEQLTKEPESEWEFGYFGRHFVLALPGDVVPSQIDKNAAPRLFELQVRTLFQHAWSEADHDVVYKGTKPLTPLQMRQCAFAAAQAWGADRVFQELFNETTGPNAPAQST